MTRRITPLFVVLLMLSSGLIAVLTAVPAPADALTREVTSTADLEGSGTNAADLDGVVVENGTIKLATSSYDIHDVTWSSGNAMDMTVDNEGKPRLALDSHWETFSGYNSDGSFLHTAVWDRDNSQVLLFGGVHDSGNTRFIHNHVWAYSPGNHQWTDLGGVNRPKFFHAAVWAESAHMMIVWGGITLVNNDLFILNETIAYRPATDDWVSLADCPYGGRVGHTAVWDDVRDQMIVMGGTPDGNFSNSTGECFAYKPSTNTWSRLQSIQANQARGGHSAVWDSQSDRMLIFGGRRRGDAMTSVHSYDPSRNTWTHRGNAPVDRWFHSASFDPINNKMYTFGGLDTGNRISARFFEYSPLQNDWRQLEVAPGRKYWTALVWDPVHSQGLTFAGAATTGNPPITSYNDVQVYTIDVPFVEEGWLTSQVYDVGGILDVGKLSWTPKSQPAACGDGAVRLQVASSGSLETPANFVGPDGTSDTYFTDPSGQSVGSHHFGGARIAYRMYFHTDDVTVTPSIDSVDMEVVQYRTRGTYVSPVYDLGQDRSRLENVRYSAFIPAEGNPHLVTVTVSIRTSKGPDMSGATRWEEISRDDDDFGIGYGQYFQFRVNITTDPWTRHLTPEFRGITIIYNSPPVLTLGMLDRVQGNRDSWFTYTITYTDVDNDEPSVSLLYIDDEPRVMSSQDTDFADGAAFTYTTPLSLGDHSYYFEFSDGKNTVRDPPVGVYSGPEVLNRVPVPVIDEPITGTRFTPSEPIQFSASMSEDPDGDSIDFRWFSSIDGDLGTHSVIIRKLTEGNHIITLEVVDEHGAKNVTQIDLLVKPYLPFLEIREIFLDRREPIEKDLVTVTAVVYNDGEADAEPGLVEFLVDDEVSGSSRETVGIGDRATVSFTWTATGDRAFLAIRTSSGDGEDVYDEAVKLVNITANSPPEVRFDLSDVTIRKGQSIVFSNNGTRDPNGDKLTVHWDFGDGTTSTEMNVEHKYSQPGVYFVNVTVTDKRGDSTVETYTITVKKKKPEDGPGFAAAIALVAVMGAAGAAAWGRSRRR